MSHFYASIQGNRGEATRTGSKKSGINGHIRGWEIGVKVYAQYNADKDQDELHIYRTGGSNGATNDKHVCTITIDGIKLNPTLKKNG